MMRDVDNTAPRRDQRVLGTVHTMWASLKAFLRRGVGVFRISVPAVEHRERHGDKIVTTKIVPVEFGQNRAQRRAAAARDRATRRRIRQHNDRLLRELRAAEAKAAEGDGE